MNHHPNHNVGGGVVQCCKHGGSQEIHWIQMSVSTKYGCSQNHEEHDSKDGDVEAELVFSGRHSWSFLAACTPLQMIHLCIDLRGGVSHFFTILVINMGSGRPSIWTQPGTQYGSWNLHRSAFGPIFPAFCCNCFSKVLTTDSQEQQDYMIKFFSDWRCLLRTILIFNGPSILTCVVQIYMSSPSSLFRAT